MKRLSRLTALLLTLAMLLSLVSIAHAEEKQSATAWLLYFASNHETDSSKFPWWPQHKSADQPGRTQVQLAEGGGRNSVQPRAEQRGEPLSRLLCEDYGHPRQRQVH